MGFEPWNEYIGAVWAGLLHRHSLDRAGCVVELGPGFAIKIGVALASVEFVGRLFVVEPNDAARAWIVESYTALLPSVEVVAVADPIARASESLPDTCDALLMNHVLDDLVLNSALPPSARDRVFASIRAGSDCRPEVAATWRRLADDETELETHRRRTLHEVRSLVAATAPRLLGASQYPSWFHTENDLGVADRVGAELLDSLGDDYGMTLSIDCHAVALANQDPTRWLFVDRIANGSADHAA